MHVPKTPGATGHIVRASPPIAHICPTTNVVSAPTPSTVASIAPESPHGEKSRDATCGVPSAPISPKIVCAVSNARR